MLLTIDIGNTQTAVGLLNGRDVVAHWRLTTVADRTEDELRVYLTGLLGLEGYRLEDISGVALSSVVPALTAAFRTVGHSMTDGPVVVVGPGVKTGMPILIDNPREVGADRIANAVAARDRHGAPVVVVDFGTSTNFDVVGAEGEYLGGVIAPGLHIATNALISGTAALRNVEYVPPRSPIGKGTVEANPQPNCTLSKYLPDTRVELRALPVKGYVLEEWTGDASGTTSPAKIIMDGNKSVTANFVQGKHRIWVPTIVRGR
mgnify:CR=1 FL=1